MVPSPHRRLATMNLPRNLSLILLVHSRRLLLVLMLDLPRIALSSSCSFAFHSIFQHGLQSGAKPLYMLKIFNLSYLIFLYRSCFIPSLSSTVLFGCVSFHEKRPTHLCIHISKALLIISPCLLKENNIIIVCLATGHPTWVEQAQCSTPRGKSFISLSFQQRTSQSDAQQCSSST